jgi:DNA-binding GntR family transcriptional regulator
LDLALLEHFSLSQRIFKVIEKAILTGTIKPGERIIETDLAKKLGTSKSPIREALRKLEGEGIVQLLPRKGYIVKEIDRKSIDDFFDIMLIVEPATVRMSLRKKQDDVCKELDEFIAKMERQLKKRGFDSYLVLNDQFHAYFYRLADNEWATKFSQMLRKRADMLRSLSLFTRNRFTPSIEEHRAIVEAYKKSDESSLLKAVENHLIRFKDNILKSELLKGKT